jgi:DNA mismatch repair protein MutS
VKDASAPARADAAPTPMMRQFEAAKSKHPGALLFFRMGDFYELFHDDAKVASKVLGLTLTSRDKERDIPMAGVPVRAMEAYLVRLVRAGHTVAICEQLQDPRHAKGIVERDVVRVVSPGTLIEGGELDGTLPLWVLALAPVEGGGCGLAWADVSTGAFRCAEAPAARIADEIARIAPAEAVLPDLHESEPLHGALLAIAAALAREGVPVARRPAWKFDAQRAGRDLAEHFGAATLEAFGVEGMDAALTACGGLFDYLRDTQKHALAQVRDLQVHRAARHLVLDRVTRRTLEIVANQRDGGRAGTLLAAVDRCETPMGARLLRDWLLEPLLDAAEIRRRHDAVAWLSERPDARRTAAAALDGMGDLERLGARLAGGRAHPRELVALARALGRLPALRAALEPGRGALDAGAALLEELRAQLDPCAELRVRIERTLADEPPLAWQDGGLIRAGYDAALDELRALARGGKDFLAALQAREQERTGLPVKIGFNSVFGYYLELTRAQSASGAVPLHWSRRQTLKNAERYVTEELKEYEDKVLGAEEKARDREAAIFAELRAAAADEVGRVLGSARAVATLDVLCGQARLAAERGWTRPEFAGGDPALLEVRDGRHPVVEQALGGEPFVPNDADFHSGRRLAVITGPNMAGKSTYLRQTALILILAQAGGFVPARSARLAPADRVFARLGGGDDIARGQSTFMVEMVETATILRHATERSLVLLDEVGRGTSTFDGLAIAWAVAEHVHDAVKARCLFATHYHQLTDLAASLPAACNLNVAVREHGGKVVFLHRIEEGGTDRSYGVHVAQLAGLPAPVLARARAVLARLERDEEDLSRRILEGKASPSAAAPSQPSLFDLLEERAPDLLAELRGLDLDALPPIEAWRILSRMREATG